MVPGLIIPRSEHIAVSDERINEIVESAHPHYLDRALMLFHGWHHPIDTTNSLLDDWVYCAENGCVTDLEAAVGASAHHDDDVHLPLLGSGYETKEARSAFVAEPDLLAIRFTADQILLSRGGIYSTAVNSFCTNDLEKQVVRADLANAKLPYEYFLKYFMRFAKEDRNSTGVFAPFEKVKEKQIEVLRKYFKRDLLYSFERECRLIIVGRKNLDRLEQDDEETVSAITGEDFKAAA